MTLKALAISVLTIELYLCVGGFIFYFLEFSTLEVADKSPLVGINFTELLQEFQEHAGYENTADGFVNYLQNRIENTTELTKTLKASKAIAASYVFAASIVTTIGYGTLVPQTGLGRCLVMIYAAFGIPLCLLGFAQLGKILGGHMANFCSKLYIKLNIKPSGRKAKVIQLALTVLSGSVPWLIIPAFLFSYVEQWSYFDGFYWLFITLSTIGFGDIVPGVFKGEIELGIFTQILYLLFGTLVAVGGIAWLAAVLTIAKDLMETKLPEKRSICSPDE